MPAPKIFENLFRLLLPPACREHVLGDLQERYRSPRSYVLDALSVLGPVVISRIRRTTDFQVFLMEAFSVYLSFTTASWYLGQRAFLYDYAGFARLAVPTMVAGVALLICNAYSDPQKQSLSKAILQSTGSISLAFLGQAVIVDKQPKFAVPLPILLYGSLFSLLLLSTLRIVFPPIQTRPKVAVVNAPAPVERHRFVSASRLQHFRDTANQVQSGPKSNLFVGVLVALIAVLATVALLVIYRIRTG